MAETTGCTAAGRDRDSSDGLKLTLGGLTSRIHDNGPKDSTTFRRLGLW